MDKYIESNNIIECWKSLEHFSFKTITSRRPKYKIIPKKDEYTVIIGGVDLSKLEKKVTEVYKKNIEIKKGELPVATLKIKDGMYVEKSLIINKYVYAMVQLGLNKDTLDFEYIDNLNSNYEEELLKITNKNNFYNQSELYLTEKSLTEFIEKIKNKLGEYSQDIYKDDYKDAIYFEKSSILLDSFYVKDLSFVSEKLYKLPNLQDYILKINKNKKIRIDNNIDELRKWTSPDKICYARWPSKYDNSLMQQVSVNIIQSMYSENRHIFSVNGPPGTGKTTLLKDVISNNVYLRAKELCKLDPQKKPFEKITIDDENIYVNGKTEKKFNKTFYEIPYEIYRYGMVVASNNNSAVENLSMELPQSDEISKEKVGTDLFDVNINRDIYFTKIMNSDYKSVKEQYSNWGLIAAKLGSRKNIRDFLKKIGMISNGNKYNLKHMYKENKIDYKEAKKRFKEAEYAVEVEIAKLKKDYEIIRKGNEIKREYLIYEKENNKLLLELDDLQTQRKDIEIEISGIKDEIKIYDKKYNFLKKIIAKITNDDKYKRLLALNVELGEEEEILSNLIKKEVNKRKAINLAENKLKAKMIEVEKNEKEISRIKNIYGNYIEDEYRNNITRNKSVQTECPWSLETLNRLRENLFLESLKLHEAFILNSTQIKQNLRMMSNFWDGSLVSYDKKIKKTMFSHLFNTLNLLAPLISTTFASVSSFLEYADINTLGMLIVDEAGQATPSSSIGALARFNYAVIVGDPLQVEPVVTVPELIKNIYAKKYNVDYDKYLLKNLSVQEMADVQNPYYGIIGDKEVGCPLVVHRRCINPMFDISNEVSYDNRMIKATIEDKVEFSIKKSNWLDIKGKEIGNKNHCVCEQIDEIVKLVERAIDFYKEDLFKKPERLFIITPFITVASEIRNSLRRIIKDESIKYFEFDYNSIEHKKFVKSWLNKNIGTVHTFQGKGANEVIFALGCDNETGKAAANWAGNQNNILNVAVSRAKFRLIIIGDKDVWNNYEPYEKAIKIMEKFNEE